MTLLIIEKKWSIILQNHEQEKTSKDMDYCHMQEIYPTNIRKKLLDTATKTRLDAAKVASKKVVQKTAKKASELIGNKTAEKNVKQRPISEATPKNVEEIFVPPEKKEKTLSKLRKVS